MKRRLDQGSLSPEEFFKLEELCEQARIHVIEMTTLANSGHIGGALGRAEMDVAVMHGAKINPENPFEIGNDIIIDSAGHYSAIRYATLALNGFFPEEDLAHFRKTGSRYEGHVSHKIPGVWMDTGILGQGLSAAVGFSLANKLLGHDDINITVMMGDGEQNKGQIAEALRFAAKYNIRNITAVIDKNKNQLSGPIEEIMPMNIRSLYSRNGWNCIEIDGHNIIGCWGALQKAKQTGLTAIISDTLMGKGYPPIEGDYNYHGKPLTKPQAKEALLLLSSEERFLRLEKKREETLSSANLGRQRITPKIKPGKPKSYTKKTDCQTAWGKALINLSEENKTPIIVVDCDLEGSVKTKEFREKFPDNFFQCGIQEHHAATMAGAMSLTGVLTFLADFGVLSVDEMFQQHRLTAINDGNLKLISTHCGLDVGEDGKTHQALDYLALSSHPGWQTFLPADANQTDRIVRYMATNYGCMHLAMGRSKIPIITKQGSYEPFFDENYSFHSGKVDKLRHYGESTVIYTYGTLAHKAVRVAEKLNEKGLGTTIMNVATPTDPDKRAINKAVTEKTKLIITYEDHYIGGSLSETRGMAPLIKSSLYDNEFHPKVTCLGVRNYGLSGKPDELYRISRLHEDSLSELILSNF